MRFKFVAFDLDGVLVDERSSWEWVHLYFGVSNKEGYDLFMDGKIDDLEFMRRDIRMWQSVEPDITAARVTEILKGAKLMDGAEETVAAIRNAGIGMGIVSGGIDYLANDVADICDIKHVVANGLEQDQDGRLTGEGVLRVELLDKGKALEELLAKLGIEPKDCVVVGNSCIDVSMFEVGGFGIAFKPIDPDCIAAANVVVPGDDLRKILPYILDGQ